MIKAEELRIGNLRKSEGIDIPRERIHSIRVGGQAFEAITAYGLYLVSTGIEFEPIPLSPEWLERAGFKDSQVYENVDEWILKPLAIQTDQEIFMVVRIGIDDLELKFVHQLQNLYFALTGNELTFKL